MAQLGLSRRILQCLLSFLVVSLIRIFRSRCDLLLENLALRQQLVVVKQRYPRPQVSTSVARRSLRFHRHPARRPRADSRGQPFWIDERRRGRHLRQMMRHLGHGTECLGGCKTAADEEFTSRDWRHLLTDPSLLQQPGSRRENQECRAWQVSEAKLNIPFDGMGYCVV